MNDLQVQIEPGRVLPARPLPRPPADGYVMPEAPLMVRQVWRALKRQWVAAVASFVLIVSAVAVGTLLRTPNYRATGLLEIRPENTDALPVAGLFGPQRLAGDSLQTQFGILRSTTLAERVVHEGLVEEGGGSWLSLLLPPSWRSAPADAESQRKVDKLQSMLLITPQEGSRLVRVSYDNPSPTRAAAVVNSMMNNYLRLSLEQAQRGAAWLQRQRDDARGKLEEAQRQLQAYVGDHGLEVVETGQGETENLVNNRLKQLQEQLATAQAERYTQQSAYELVSRQASGGMGGGVSSPVIDDLSVRLADLRREAAGLSATFHEEYPRLQEVRRQIKALESSVTNETQMVVNRARRDYGSALRKEALLQNALEQQQRTARALQSSSAGYASLKREVATNQDLYQALDQKLKEVNITAALEATHAGVIDPAKPPREPYQSPLALNLAVGIILGLVGAVGVALVRDANDDSLRHAEDLEGVMGVATVGVIPHVPAGRRRRALGSGRVATAEPIIWADRASGRRKSWFQIDRSNRYRPVLADAFATLRAEVVCHDELSKARSLLVTSPGVGDGKTTVSVNLALSLSRLGHRVLLVDGDMRRPSIHKALDLPASEGLAAVLLGAREWPSVVQADVFPRLAVLVAGTPQLRAGDLLASERMRRFLADARQTYEYVVIDSPPLLPYMPDARVLAGVVDGVLLTVRCGSTQRDVALRAMSQLRHAVGLIVNDFHSDRDTSYYGADADDDVSA